MGHQSFNTRLNKSYQLKAKEFNFIFTLVQFQTSKT